MRALTGLAHSGIGTVSIASAGTAAAAAVEDAAKNNAGRLARVLMENVLHSTDSWIAKFAAEFSGKWIVESIPGLLSDEKKMRHGPIIA